MNFMALVTYLTDIYHTPLTVQYITIPVTIKPHALVSKRMLVSMNMDTLVFTPKYFHWLHAIDSSVYYDTCHYKTTCIGIKKNASKYKYGYFSIYTKEFSLV